MIATTLAPTTDENGAEQPVSATARSLTTLGKHEQLAVLTAEPLNVETPVALLDGSQLTPVEHLFMRNNYDLPVFDPLCWRLTIDGLVRRPLSLDYAALCALPTTSVVAVLECSGNGRSMFAATGSPAEGLPWGHGAVGCAEWTGVPLALLLERAGVDPCALQAECVSAGVEPFVRGVEVAKLLEHGLLALAVNGAPLPWVHGGPVRLVVPGWGGVNWVKWLSCITLIAGESQSAFNQESYVVYDAEGRATGKVRALQVRALLTYPEPGATLRAGTHELRGLAWSAGQGIAQVELSANGGASWQLAQLGAELGPQAWRSFGWHWHAEPGTHTLMARATDGAGQTQPLAVPFNRKGYLNNAVQPIEVLVR